MRHPQLRMRTTGEWCQRVLFYWLWVGLFFFFFTLFYILYSVEVIRIGGIDSVIGSSQSIFCWVWKWLEVVAFCDRQQPISWVCLGVYTNIHSECVISSTSHWKCHNSDSESTVLENYSTSVHLPFANRLFTMFRGSSCLLLMHYLMLWYLCKRKWRARSSYADVFTCNTSEFGRVE